MTAYKVEEFDILKQFPSDLFMLPTFPHQTMLRIWDTFLYEGSKVLFRFAIAVFKYYEEELLGMENSIQIFNRLRTMCQDATDINRLAQVRGSQRIHLISIVKATESNVDMYFLHGLELVLWGTDLLHAECQLCVLIKCRMEVYTLVQKYAKNNCNALYSVVISFS